MHLSISQRLHFALGVAVLALGVSTALVWRFGLEANHRMDLASDIGVGSAALADTQSAVWELRWGVAQYLASSDAASRAKVVERSPVVRTEAEKSMTAYAATVSTENERLALGKMRDAFARYTEARVKFFELMGSGQVDEAAKFRAATLTPAGGATNAALAALVDMQRKNSVAASEEAKHGIALWRNVAMAFMALGALSAAVVIAWVARSITRPIGSAVTVMNKLAQGDLATPVAVNRRDELGVLLQAMEGMRGNLARIVGNVRTGIDNVAVASGEIAQGNLDLSSRTEQQASSLQETASAMEQMTSTVSQSADNARAANQLATGASDAASKGGEVVGQVVATMGAISDSSRRIADIIGVIDGIAFQTNILALNAAVEAARAGEQGRGFAVVASEVRSLAQRSAEAAKEIKSLISASVEKVEAGNRQAAAAGEAMSDIVTQVQRVTDLIAEISSATQEQSQGLGQVNQTVTQLDQMTQQNAALVEQSSAAAASLKSQADALARAVEAFKVHG